MTNPTTTDPIEERLHALEDRIKQNETSLFRAISQFLRDSLDYHAGRTKEFPVSAALGLVNAMLLRKSVIIVAGVLGAFIAVAQVFLLWQQNKLIIQQNNYIQTQSRSNAMEAVASLFSTLDDDPQRLEIALAPFGMYGREAFDSLMAAAGTLHPGLAGSLTRSALARGASTHTPEEAKNVLYFLLQGFNIELAAACPGGSNPGVASTELSCSMTNPTTGRDLVAAAADDVVRYVQDAEINYGRTLVSGDDYHGAFMVQIAKIYVSLMLDRRGTPLRRSAEPSRAPHDRDNAIAEMDLAIAFLCASELESSVSNGFFAKLFANFRIDPNAPDYTASLQTYVSETALPSLCSPRPERYSPAGAAAN